MGENDQSLGGREKRVLSLDPAGLLWGSERALLDFIGEIPGFGAACCCPPDTPLIGKLKARQIQYFPTFQANLHLRGSMPKAMAVIGLMRAISTFHPHVLHVNQAGATRLALLASRVFRIPSVSHVRLLEDVEYLNGLKPQPSHLLRLIAISPAIRGAIRNRPDLKAIPCTMLLDAYRIQFDISGGETACSKKWDFVCVGRISESKGQEILIKAIKELRQKTNTVPRVAFVGEINEAGRKLQAVLGELQLGSTVEFVGHLDDVGEILRQSRWLVCPSKYEPLGRVLFEAWDAGIPVIAGAFSGGAAESVKASCGGILFEEWSPASLAESLATAITMDLDAANEMAKAGRAWLTDATDPTRYAANMAGIFDQAICNYQLR